jgi:hypothetical protein
MHRHNYKFDFSVARLREAIATLKVTQALERLRLKAGFDPNQPRVPAGNPDGGQWTRVEGWTSSRARSRDRRHASEAAPRKTPPAGSRRTFRDHTGNEPWKSRTEHYRADGSVASQTVENRDGSRIDVFYPAHGTGSTAGDARSTVKLPGGQTFTFEMQGGTQRLFDGRGQLLSEAVWTPNGPQSQATVQPVGLTLQQANEVLEAGRVLYNALSSQNSAEQRACVAFTSREYRPGRSIAEPAVFVGMLNRVDVESACKRLGEVESITNGAYKFALDEPMTRRPAELGTRVHWLIAREVNGFAPSTHGRKPHRDPNFVAEASFLKAKEETYGTPGSIRVDVLEDAGNRTVCVYDIKTGKSGLLPGRSREIANAVRTHYGPANRIIVTEVRPRQP